MAKSIKKDKCKILGFFMLIYITVIFLSIQILLELLSGRKGGKRILPFSQVDVKQYFINTAKCRIPWVDPFGPQIEEIFKPEKYENCSNGDAVISKLFDDSRRRYILKINFPNLEEVVCCYKQIVRSEFGSHPDNEYRILPCAYFHQDFIVPQHIDAMIVECKITTNISIRDAFSFVQDRLDLKLNRIRDRIEKPSVILFIINSLSPFNFRRNMPKTAKFLMENGWFELKGYNKVGNTTFPNAMAFMTGLNESSLYTKCYPQIVGGLDKCNFIWKEYKAHGYETAYAEDEAKLNTFNFARRKGFKKAPTDYYLRPLILAIENNLEIKAKHSLKFCIGRRHAAEYIYDFGLEFAKKHRIKPGFGIFWTNSFSHDDFATPSSMDFKILEYLERMKSDRVFKTSIIMLFSDHGFRKGPLLNLSNGFLEERLPMFFISLPKWFYKVYPYYVEALRINANRLTSPFDIYQTLKHILNLNQTRKNFINPAFSCATAQSIFHEISNNRTCADACIPEEWCACLLESS